jgi:pyruvate dehydrogenase E1 component beta subunit
VAEGDHLVPFGKARVVQEGRGVTVVSWSAQVHVCAEAVRGLDAELIDLRTLWPWDRETVLASVARTGRLLVVHEAVRVGGFGAEIAASVAEETGVPVRRLGAPRALIGYAPPVEDAVRVTAAMVAAAVREMTA